MLKENQLLSSYLSSLPDLINYTKSMDSSHYLDIIMSMSMLLKYEFFSKNRILFKKGEVADKCYLIIKGKACSITPNPVNILMSWNEYIEYLNVLKDNEEIELLQYTIYQNSLIYSIPDNDYRNLNTNL